MATYFARKTGNINAADVWATTPSGTASNLFPSFTNADVLMANSFTIIVNVNTTVAEVRTDTTGGATVGGGVTLNEGVTLTGNIIFGTSGSGTYNGTFPNSATLVGNITANSGRFTHGGTGVLNITGNLTGGTGSNAPAVYVTSNGILNVTGNVTGGSSASGYGIWNQGAGTINVTGNSTGGSGSPGIYNQITGTCTIGQCIGGTGSFGAINASTGTIRLTRAVGNAYGPGNTAGLAAAPGAANLGLGVIEIEQIEFGTLGQVPITGTGIRLKKANSNVAVFNFCDTAGSKTLIDATQNAAMPAASNVRSGLSYAGGAATGTLAVPLPSQVAVGVATDNTIGTAFVTGSDIATAVWGAATRTLTTSSGPTAAQIRTEMDSNSTKLANLDAAVSSRLAPSGTLATVTTLTNAPTVPSAATIASQVRTELSVELNRVDQAISSRATPADITAIKAKTDAINVDRINNTATLSQVGNLLAQANS